MSFEYICTECGHPQNPPGTCNRCGGAPTRHEINYATLYDPRERGSKLRYPILRIVPPGDALGAKGDSGETDMYKV